MRTNEFKKEIKEMVKLADEYDNYQQGVVGISYVLEDYIGYDYHKFLSLQYYMMSGYDIEHYEQNLKNAFSIIKKICNDKKLVDIEKVISLIIYHLTFGDKQYYTALMSQITNEDGEIVLEEDKIRM